MSHVISVDELSGTIISCLGKYNQVIVKGTKDEAKKQMDRLVKETKATAPKRYGHYVRNISSKKEYENAFGAEYLWYVKAPNYRLSHLLEYGHAKRNGGRTKAYHFIRNASDPIINDYEKAIEEIIQNGANSID